MTNPVTAPLIRRALLELLTEIGGEQNHEVLAALLNEAGQRVAVSDTRTELEWLRDAGCIHAEQLGPFLMARILADGRDIAEGRKNVDGVWRYRLGE